MTKHFVISEDLNVARDVNIKGNRVRGTLSPLDVPYQAIANYNKGSKEFVLEFSYVGPREGESKTEENTKENNVTVVVGEFSGRLFRIVISGVTDERQIPNIVVKTVLHVQKEVEKSTVITSPFSRWLNLAMVKDFVEKERDQIRMVAAQ